MTFGERLRQLRKAKNLNQSELADKVGINFTYLSKIENEQLDFAQYPSPRTRSEVGEGAGRRRGRTDADGQESAGQTSKNGSSSDPTPSASSPPWTTTALDNVLEGHRGKERTNEQAAPQVPEKRGHRGRDRRPHPASTRRRLA